MADYGEAVGFKCSETFHPEGKACVNLVHLDGKWSECVTIATVDIRTGRPVFMHFDNWSEVQAFIDTLNFVVEHYSKQAA